MKLSTRKKESKISALNQVRLESDQKMQRQRQTCNAKLKWRPGKHFLWTNKAFLFFPMLHSKHIWPKNCNYASNFYPRKRQPSIIRVIVGERRTFRVFVYDSWWRNKKKNEKVSSRATQHKQTFIRGFRGFKVFRSWIVLWRMNSQVFRCRRVQ